MTNRNHIDHWAPMPAIHCTPHSASQHTPYSIKIGSDPQSHNKCYHIPVMKTLMLWELKGAIWQNVNVIQLIELLFPDQSLDYNIDEALNHNIPLSQSLMWQLSLCEPSIGNCKTAEFRVTVWLNKISGLFGASTTSNTTSNSLVVNLPWLWNSDHSKPRQKANPTLSSQMITCHTVRCVGVGGMYMPSSRSLLHHIS